MISFLDVDVDAESEFLVFDKSCDGARFGIVDVADLWSEVLNFSEGVGGIH